MTDRFAVIKERWLETDYSKQNYIQADQDIQWMVGHIERQQISLILAENKVDQFEWLFNFIMALDKSVVGDFLVDYKRFKKGEIDIGDNWPEFIR